MSENCGWKVPDRFSWINIVLQRMLLEICLCYSSAPLQLLPVSMFWRCPCIIYFQKIWPSKEVLVPMWNVSFPINVKFIFLQYLEKIVQLCLVLNQRTQYSLYSDWPGDVLVDLPVGWRSEHACGAYMRKCACGWWKCFSPRFNIDQICFWKLVAGLRLFFVSVGLLR